MCSGPGVAANEQSAALDERPQLGQVELPEIQHPLSRWTEGLPGRGRDAGRRLPIGGSRAEHDPPAGDRRQRRNEPDVNAGFGPAPERIAGADMNDDELVSRGDARMPSQTVCDAAPRPATSGAISTESCRRIRLCRRATRRIASSRSHWFTTECRGRSSRGRAHRSRIHPRPPGDLVADSLRRSR